jgi:hypothetical protein
MDGSRYHLDPQLLQQLYLCIAFVFKKVEDL